MGLNMQALADAQEDLKKRGGSSINWIQPSKMEKPIDFRIMDPLPQMNGIYFVEVPIYWIDGTRIISPKLFGPQEHDCVHEAILEAKRSKDPDILRLLSAKNEKGSPKIADKTEWWIPGCQFNWEVKGDKIQGIYDAQGNVDPNLVRKFIADDRWKILVAGVQLLKAINEIATKRGGSVMTERLTGFNLIISKTGKDRETKYFAQKDEVYPMPAEFYTPEKMIDPFELAQSQMFTDEYMDAVVGKYLYNEELPERTEDCYAYPELREKFKNLMTEELVEEKPVQRARPGRGAAPATVVEPPAPPAVEAPAARSRRAPAETPAPQGRAAAAGRGRSTRNLSEDLKNVD